LGAVPTVEKTTAQELSDFVLGTFGITAPDSAEHLVKRVIGMPGDVVTCCDEDGRIMVNGVAIDEVYLKPGVTPSDIEFSVEVPAGQYWVMGDNRPNSTDSRYHQDLPTKGFVPEGIVVGRALVISWPFDNWTYLDNYSEVFGGVPKP
jgi:signal peptidase I